MRRQLIVFLFCTIFSLLGTGYLLSLWPPKAEPVEIFQPVVTAPNVREQPEPVPNEPTSRYITSSPCECDGDRLLYLADPWIRGSEVVELQKILQKSGEKVSGIDGVFGPETAQAVKKFKVKHGLPANDRVDLETWRTLADQALPVAGTKTPPPPGEVRIYVNLSERKLTVYSDEIPYKSYPIAAGKPETPTPVGYFKITSKEKWGEGFGTRWMQIDVRYGKYGIHGTNKPWSIGGFESHGCIRMHNRHVEEIFEWVKIGTRVHIDQGPWGELGGRPTLRFGVKGTAVVTVQRRLAELGYYTIWVDGIYGRGSIEAVKKFQAEYGLKATGVVDQATYDALGLIYFE